MFGYTLGGYLWCFRMVLTHFGLPRPQFGSLIILHEACRCLVVCKRGIWGLSRFRGIWGEKSPPKKRVQSGPKDASSAYLFFIRVTELVSLWGTNLGLHRDYWSGVGCRAPPPPPPPPPFFLAWPYLRPIDPKSKISKLTG